MTEQVSNVTLGLTRKSLEGTLIYACQKCGAPGVYRSDVRTRDMWPDCYDKRLAGKPVGLICPNCGVVRRNNKDLGELTASMPRWVWNLVLGFKWCLIKVRGAFQ